MARGDLATYTLDRDLASGLWVVLGRWPDGSVINDREGPAEWAFTTEADARLFWKALITVSEVRDEPSRFLDRLGVLK